MRICSTRLRARGWRSSVATFAAVAVHQHCGCDGFVVAIASAGGCRRHANASNGRRMACQAPGRIFVSIAVRRKRNREVGWPGDNGVMCRDGRAEPATAVATGPSSIGSLQVVRWGWASCRTIWLASLCFQSGIELGLSHCRGDFGEMLSEFASVLFSPVVGPT